MVFKNTDEVLKADKKHARARRRILEKPLPLLDDGKNKRLKDFEV